MSSPSALPDELLTAVLEHLPHDQLRNASQASRNFYRAAHEAGLSLHRTMYSNLPYTLTTFTNVLEHAEAQPQLFRLELTLLVCSRPSDDDEGLFSLNELWHALRRAMPLLVRLDLTVDSELAAEAYATLDDVPAPQLRRLSLVVLPDGTTTTPFPATLFGGDAPRLRSLALDVPALVPTWPVVAAWRGVRELSVGVSDRNQQLAIAHFFPVLDNMNITVICWEYPGPTPCVDLAGAVVEHLTIKNDTTVPLQFVSNISASDAPRPRIGTVSHLCCTVHHDESLWPDSNCDLNTHIQAFYTAGEKSGAVLSITGADWRNTQYTNPAPGADTDVHALSVLPHMRKRLVSLTIDAALLAPLLQMACGLDALRELCVDCTPVRNAPARAPAPESALSCPALECVAMFSTSADSATRGAVTHESIRAIGHLQICRRARLVLSCVRVVGDEEGLPELWALFGSVCIVGDAEASNMPEYYQSREDNLRLSPWGWL